MTKEQGANEAAIKALRQTLGTFATGVVIVTARDEANDTDVGMTMSSFNSVSMEPPLVLFSIAKNAYSRDVFRNADSFGINVLAHDQADLAMKFARPLTDKWADLVPSRGQGNVALFSEAAATFECAPFACYDGGDHDIFVVEVLRHNVSDQSQEPLVFHQGSFKAVA